MSSVDGSVTEDINKSNLIEAQKSLLYPGNRCDNNNNRSVCSHTDGTPSNPVNIARCAVARTP